MDGLSYKDYLKKLAERSSAVEDEDEDEDEYQYLLSIIHKAQGSTEPKVIARFRFAVQAMCVEVIKDKPGVMPQIIRDGTLELKGYLEALLTAKENIVRKGASGRRLIGATTRERARQEAHAYRGKLSRDAAAPLIAEAIGKAPATVRRMLSELFPGDAWNLNVVDESTDPSH